MGNLAQKQDWYRKLVDELKLLAYEGIVKTKHAIGRRIIQDELKFGKPEYGSKQIETLAKDLGTTKNNLWLCVQFAKKFDGVKQFKDTSWRDITHNYLPKTRPKAKSLPLPEGKYRVIYADPPWEYGDKCEDGGVQSAGAEKHYPVMNIKELCDMRVTNITAENAVLFLWVTSPLLAECWPVIEAWGFEYKASFIWDKVKHNMGHYNSVRHELLLVCTKGSCLPDNKKLYNSVQSIERTKHSEKPEKFRKIIDTLYPKGKRIELFARAKADKWDAYGNEIP